MIHKTGIQACQDALMQLGQDVFLESVDVNSKNIHERKCALVYEACRLAVLRSHPWGFVRRVMKVQPSQRKIALPNDCLRLLDCKSWDGRLLKYVLGADKIVTIPHGGCDHVIYLRDEEDLDEWDVSTRRALICRLAADLAKPITGLNVEREYQELAYATALADAKTQDASECQSASEIWGRNHYFDVMQGRTPLPQGDEPMEAHTFKGLK